MDTTWLAIVNEERECLGGNRIQEWMLENVMEAAEEICYIKRRTASAIEAESVNNPEFDANARCDICQSVCFSLYLISIAYSSTTVRTEMN